MEDINITAKTTLPVHDYNLLPLLKHLPLQNHVHALYEKIQEMSDRYLNYNYLETQTKNLIKAKVKPLSQPPGFKEKLKKTKMQISILKAMKADRKELLTIVLKKIEHASGKQKTLLEEQKQLISTQYTKINESLLIKNEKFKYLNLQKISQVGGRFAGYIGTAANAVAPGSGVLVSVALTAANTAAQENLAENLPQDKELNEEKRNVRISTLLTVASTAASVFFTIYALPVIKDTAWHLWKSSSPI